MFKAFLSKTFWFFVLCMQRALGALLVVPARHVWKVLSALSSMLSLVAPGKTSGSKIRNLISGLAFIASSLLLFELIIAPSFETPFISGQTAGFGIASFWVGVAVFVFGFNVIGVLAIHDRSYKLSAPRLIRDVAISAFLTIVAFALFYRFVGLSTGNDEAVRHVQCLVPVSRCTCDASLTDTLYFSIVTFSTLGFGDFTACQYKLLTAIQALLGNLHLGFFVGAVFYYLTQE